MGRSPESVPRGLRLRLTRLLSELDGSALTRAQSNVGVSHSPLRSAVTGRIQPVVATPLIEEVFMGRPAGWMRKLTGRGAMRSPGAPSHRREIERRFWEQIATGITSEKAAEAVGVSQAVGTRWFRHNGGMPLSMLSPISGRYLSFAEREEIGLLSHQGVGVRDIARRIGRSPSTVSRELTRNAATRGGQLEYRASVAQWKAELVAKRPKPSKLVTNPRLRHYVQDRLEGKVRDADGREISAPASTIQREKQTASR